MLERIASGRTDLVFELADQPPTAAHDGVPLIRWCAYYGDVSAIRHLLALGESLATLGENLDLAGAAFHGHWRLCQYLIEQGADATRADPRTGETPLHAALSRAQRPAATEVLRILLAAGADPDAATRPGVATDAFMRDARTRGETPLHRAAAFGSEEAIALLLAAGATIDAKDAHGDTPLAWASWHLRPDAVLRKLCHGGHTIHPARNSAYDHGQGFGALDASLLGRPHVEPR